MTGQLRKRSVLITGGSKGIGFATAMQLLKHGHRVVALSRTPPPEPNPRLTWIESDVTQLEKIEKSLPQIASEHQIDALLSNAGQPSFGNIEEWSSEQISEHLKTNLLSHMVVASALMPHLRMQNTSDLIFMGSIAAIKPGKKASVYIAAKAGLKGFAQSLRYEASSKGVRVSLIQPGMVQTDFYNHQSFTPGEHPSQHLKALDVAALVDHILQAPPSVVFDECTLSPINHVVQKS